ncbi:MAG: 50S ribosomal protein L11 methyltransferase [Cyanobacteriota bacterium]|nr:50S ribosomal protein L11 methyltransferase [Cyanobacteriota bacterium]
MTPDQEDLVFWRLETMGCQGMTSEGRGDHLQVHAYIPFAKMTLLDLAALALQLRQDALLAGFPAPQVRWERLESEDWSSSWKAHWHPQEIGDHLLICPAWLEPPPHPNRHLLWINPGMAFGTGTHPTTQLCMEALEMRLDNWGEEKTPITVADIGCGSGILAVAAALLGANKVYAVDTDPLAVEASLYNRDHNHLTDKIEVFQGSLEHVPEMVDGLVCNILADTILDMIPEFKLVVKENGWLILSGILVEQAKFVAETLEANDWVVAALWKQKEWCCLNVRAA